MTSTIKHLFALLLLATAETSWSDPVAVTKYVGAWSSTGKYLAGQLVSHDNKSWLAIKKNTDSQPGQSPDSWITLGSNVQGPKGDTGPQGQKGDPGVQGPVGAIGPIGPKGPEGIQGVAGPSGPQGVPGINGETGPRGPTGPQGARGATGSPGGINVFDARGQYLGLMAGSSDQVLIPSTSYLAQLSSGEPQSNTGDVSDLSFLINGVINVSGYDPKLYLSADCSGQPVSPGPGYNYYNQIHKNGNQTGIFSVTARYPQGSVKSTQYTGNQCDLTVGTPERWFQSEPPKMNFCLPPTPNSRQFIAVASKVEAGTCPGCVDLCAQNGLTSPCYGCSQRERNFYPTPTVSYSFTPVNLPFTLPVSLPLKYVAP